MGKVSEKWECTKRNSGCQWKQKIFFLVAWDDDGFTPGEIAGHNV